MPDEQFIAKFRNVTGRYLVTRSYRTFEGQRIADKRQAKYGNPPDPSTGLYLYESFRVFDASELVSLRPVKTP